ncbi:MAG: glycosyltransferase family 2 protein [Candidatus Hydrogenedentes bacterium]|nr:glycosyltransferase family 2 protein [Candidatus Hydrogenedentota bacterium]
MPRVLVIIPAYNEQETIGAVLHSLKAHAPGYDVLVVDDGSRDNTAAVVRSAGVELIRLPLNLGIGGAMQTGFKYAWRAGYDVAVQCDADGQHPVENISMLVERLAESGADMVIGSRYVSSTEYTPSFYRRVGKSILSRIVDFFIGGGITDTTSGFRAINRRALDVLARHYPEDYPEAEVLVILHRSGLTAIEVPVQMHARQGGESSIRWPQAVYYMAKVVLAIFIDMFRKFMRTPGEE